MRKRFHNRCTLTTVVISPREFKGSPAMLAASLEMVDGMARHTA
jgi:hypothetical protein